MMMKQTLKQRIGNGIVLAAAGLGSLVGGCATQTVYKTPEQIQQEDREFEEASGLAGSLLFGMVGAGALDSQNRTIQQNLAMRGATSGLQQYQMNDAIRNSGQVNVYINSNDDYEEKNLTPEDRRIRREREKNRAEAATRGRLRN